MAGDGADARSCGTGRRELSPILRVDLSRDSGGLVIVTTYNYKACRTYAFYCFLETWWSLDFDARFFFWRILYSFLT